MPAILRELPRALLRGLLVALIVAALSPLAFLLVFPLLALPLLGLYAAADAALTELARRTRRRQSAAGSSGDVGTR